MKPATHTRNIANSPRLPKNIVGDYIAILNTLVDDISGLHDAEVDLASQLISKIGANPGSHALYEAATALMVAKGKIKREIDFLKNILQNQV